MTATTILQSLWASREACAVVPMFISCFLAGWLGEIYVNRVKEKCILLGRGGKYALTAGVVGGLITYWLARWGKEEYASPAVIIFSCRWADRPVLATLGRTKKIVGAAFDFLAALATTIRATRGGRTERDV